MSWADLMAAPSEEELHVVCQCDTHFEAVRRLLERRGLRVWTGTSALGGIVTRALLTPYPDRNPDDGSDSGSGGGGGGEVYAAWGTTHFGTEKDWRARESNWHTWSPEAALDRRDLVEQALDALRDDPSPNTAVRVFTGDHAKIDDHEGARAIRAAIVKAWWETRLAEGHTPDSARTLLRLMVPPAAWATYDALLDALRPPHPSTDADLPGT